MEVRVWICGTGLPGQLLIFARATLQLSIWERAREWEGASTNECAWERTRTGMCVHVCVRVRVFGVCIYAGTSISMHLTLGNNLDREEKTFQRKSEEKGDKMTDRWRERESVWERGWKRERDKGKRFRREKKENGQILGGCFPLLSPDLITSTHVRHTHPLTYTSLHLDL